MSSNTVPKGTALDKAHTMYGNYIPNNYVERMYCFYCLQCKKDPNNSEEKCYNGMCKECGIKMFGQDTINVYTPKIPAREYYDYNAPKLFGINGRFMPNIMPYGSYNGTFINKGFL